MDPVTGIQKLTGFQDHFDHVFVAVVFGAFTGVPVKEEDIHLAGCLPLWRSTNPFYTTLREPEPESAQERLAAGETRSR